MIYDNLSDAELIRVADGQTGLVKALSERLDMRQTPPDTLFTDVADLLRSPGGLPAPLREWVDSLILDSDTPDTVPAQDVLQEAVMGIFAIVAYALHHRLPVDEGWDLLVHNVRNPESQTPFESLFTNRI